MLSKPACTCGGYHAAEGTTLVLVRASEDCPAHGKALRKRGTDDWTAIMGTTPPNQAEIEQNGRATHVQ